MATACTLLIFIYLFHCITFILIFLVLTFFFYLLFFSYFSISRAITLWVDPFFSFLRVIAENGKVVFIYTAEELDNYNDPNNPRMTNWIQNLMSQEVKDLFLRCKTDEKFFDRSNDTINENIWILETTADRQPAKPQSNATFNICKYSKNK